MVNDSDGEDSMEFEKYKVEFNIFVMRIVKLVFLLFVLLFCNLTMVAYDALVDGIYYNLDKDSRTAEVTNDGYKTYLYSGISNIIIPSTINCDGISYKITSIGEKAFWSCTNILSIEIPSTVEVINDYALSGCSGLARIIIPNSVVEIGNNSLSGCSGLTEITIPSSVKMLGSVVFGDCSKLSSVSIPNSITTIRESSFLRCKNLKDITIPNSVTRIEDSAFQGSGLVNIIIPNSVSFFPDDFTGRYNVFKDCNYLKRVELHCPEVKDVFKSLSSLSEIVIGSEVSSIASYAFSGCNNLSSIKVEKQKPINITGNVFSNYNATLYVPQGSKTAYQTAAYWKDFKEIVEYESTAIHELSISSDRNGSVSYSNNTICDETKTFKVEEGESATLSFTPNSGYQIESLKVNNVDITPYIDRNKNTYTISNIKKDITVEVTFEAIPPTTHTLTIKSSGSGSVSCLGYTISGAEKKITVNEGTSATLTFTPNSGYQIGSVKINGVVVTVSNNRYTISSITTDTTVEVTFEAIPPTTHTLTIKSSGSGSVSCLGYTISGAEKNITVNEGTSAMLTFTPNSGYQIGSVKVDGVAVTVSNNRYTISSITKDTTIEVTFEAIPPTVFKLIIISSGSGSVSCSGYTISGGTKNIPVNEGTSATLTFTPNSGYQIESVKVDGVVVTVSNNRYTISSITKNTTVEVTFEAIPPTTHTLTIKSLGSGSVSCLGYTINGTEKKITVNEGTSATLTFTPNSGYQVGSVKVGGVAVTISNNRYTISNINKDITVEVTFEAIPPTTHTLTIKSSGSGSVSCLGYTINGTEKKITVNDGTSAMLTFTPNSGYQIGSVKVDGVAVTVSNNRYTISSITKDTTIEVTFEAIPPTTHTLTIKSSGSGSVSCLGYTINGTEKKIPVNEGTSATLTFTPNSGYQVRSVKVNGVAVTVSNNRYTISSITKDTTIEVTFEAIPPTTHTLTIKSSGSGSVSCLGYTINGTEKKITVNEGTSATLTFTPNSGYQVGSVKVDGVAVTVSNNRYTISSITKDTTVEVTFEAIPPTTYKMTITSSENGYVTFAGTTTNNGKPNKYTVNEGTSATLTFTPNSGYKVGSLKVNNADVTSYINNNTYIISNINKDITVEVTFEQINMSLTYNGVNYRITSSDNGTVNVASGSYGQSLKVPAAFYANGKTWQVKGMDSGVLTSNPQLAAVIWEAFVKFDASPNNPNFLLYVTSADYAPSTIKNVIVNGTANSITLTETTSGNDFYCPEAFTAQSISYTHNYMMTTGIGESLGWETIALPFDVQTIIHSTKGEIIPFAKWNNGDSRCPFWLYELTSSGWREASAINAYTPYIISMPNNDKYYYEVRLNGEVTFSATNVTVKPTDIKTASYQGKTFTPNFTTTSASASIYALNVKNQWAQNTNSQKEGSTFVQNLRTIHPFEAYMSSENSTRSSFPIFEDMTTGIRGITELIDMKRIEGVYNLKGQKIKVEADGKLPAGIYIINGQKVIVK